MKTVEQLKADLATAQEVLADAKRKERLAYFALVAATVQPAPPTHASFTMNPETGRMEKVVS